MRFNDFKDKCYYCERPFGIAPYGSENLLTATVDHIIPRSKGGTNAKENLVKCCTTCNYCKSDLLLEDFVFRCEVRIGKADRSYIGIPFSRLSLVVENGKKLLANDSKNPDPTEIVTFVRKKRNRRFKELFPSRFTELLNENELKTFFAKSEFDKEVQRQYAIRQTEDLITRIKNEPEPNFHYED